MSIGFGNLSAAPHRMYTQRQASQLAFSMRNKDRDDNIDFFSGRPKRDDVIDKDEITGLIIDLQTMDTDSLYNTYFNTPNKPRKEK